MIISVEIDSEDDSNSESEEPLPTLPGSSIGTPSSPTARMLLPTVLPQTVDAVSLVTRSTTRSMIRTPTTSASQQRMPLAALATDLPAAPYAPNPRSRTRSRSWTFQTSPNESAIEAPLERIGAPLGAPVMNGLNLFPTAEDEALFPSLFLQPPLQPLVPAPPTPVTVILRSNYLW